MEGRANTFWNIFYIVLVVLVVVALLSFVYPLGQILATVIYTLVVALAVMAILHWLGAF